MGRATALASSIRYRDTSMSHPKSAWNSLEVAKLVIGLLTPLVVALVGFWVNSTVAAQNRAWQLNDQLVARRLAVYDEVRTKLNTIYCFVEDIGRWKDETPESITDLRREVHAIMHTNRALWPPDTFAAYLDYMDRVAFKTYSGVGEDAKIRTSLNMKGSQPGWASTSKNLIAPEKDPSHRESYDQVINLISRDLQHSVDPTAYRVAATPAG
jgi:hypothetical protein